MWECANCGEAAEDDFDVCWNCQTEKGNLSAKDIWQQKSDQELITASEHLSEYTKGAEEVIRAELHRRRMSEPEPTIRAAAHAQRKQPMNSRITKGIIVLVFGLALIIISPTLTFTETSHTRLPSGFDILDSRTNTGLKDFAFFGGIALLLFGGIISAVGFNQFRSTQLTTPSAPTTQPIVTQSVSPMSVELGNTRDEVQSVMGQPDKIINLGARVIHVYKDMKIIYVGGKVADVHLS